MRISFQLATVLIVVSFFFSDSLMESIYAQAKNPTQSNTNDQSEAKQKTRTKKEVVDLIAQEGRKQPVWWESAKPDVPKTLDLSYDQPKPGEPWDNQKNIGQYIWDVVNPNPGRWKSGIRFFHTLLQRHKDDTEKRTRIMFEIASMYYRYEQDYARAAFWWEKAEVTPKNPMMYVHLAECYWKLGNKEMALELLKKSWSLTLPQVKLLADMGETDQSLKLCDSISRSTPLIGNFYAGDACRVAGRNKDALAYYQKAVDSAKLPNAKWERYRERALANIAGLKAFELLDLTKIKDGTYKSESMGYEAPIKIEVTVKAGRIEDVRVTESHEKQFYSSITDTCRNIKEKQGVKDVDATSGATMTSEAIINATAKALAAAMQ